MNPGKEIERAMVFSKVVKHCGSLERLADRRLQEESCGAARPAHSQKCCKKKEGALFWAFVLPYYTSDSTDIMQSGP